MVTKTTDTGHPPDDPIWQFRHREQYSDCLSRVSGDAPTGRGQGVHFLPEIRRYIEAVERNLTQPLMFLFQDKGLAPLSETCAVAIQNYVDNITEADLDLPFRCVQDRADGQAH